MGTQRGISLAGMPQQLRRHDAETINSILELLVEPLQLALLQPTEVVLHDLRRVPNTVRAISGNVTGRRVGDPPTDKLLQRIARGQLDHQIGYSSSLPDGRQLRCSTIIFLDAVGDPAAALCINSDVSAWLSARSIVDGFLFGHTPSAVFSREETGDGGAVPPVVDDEPSDGEYFPKDVEELAGYLIRNALEKVGVPAYAMRKDHKLKVVAELQERGFFLVKDATETIAHALGVTRFTIYNYLNEINGPGDAKEA